MPPKSEAQRRAMHAAAQGKSKVGILPARKSQGKRRGYCVVAQRLSRMAKKCGLREAHVHFGMFDFAAWVVVGKPDRLREYVAWRHEKSADLVPDPRTFNAYGCRACVFYHRTAKPVMWLPRRPATPVEIGALTHESLHVVCRLADWAALDLTEASEETYCHAVAYLVRRILEEF